MNTMKLAHKIRRELKLEGHYHAQMKEALTLAWAIKNGKTTYEEVVGIEIEEQIVPRGAITLQDIIKEHSNKRYVATIHDARITLVGGGRTINVDTFHKNRNANLNAIKSVFSGGTEGILRPNRTKTPIPQKTVFAISKSELEKFDSIKAKVGSGYEIIAYDCL